MVNGIPAVQAMFRRKGTKVVAAAKEAARKGGEDVASAMRYLAPRNAQTFPESPAGSQA